jgi:hypothetical protein
MPLQSSGRDFGTTMEVAVVMVVDKKDRGACAGNSELPPNAVPLDLRYGILEGNNSSYLWGFPSMFHNLEQFYFC